jgi:hypothetical protein
METGCKGCKAIREFLTQMKNAYGIFSKEEKVEGDINDKINYSRNKINELINKAKENGEK